jgi:hypothetical protein
MLSLFRVSRKSNSTSRFSGKFIAFLLCLSLLFSAAEAPMSAYAAAKLGNGSYARALGTAQHSVPLADENNKGLLNLAWIRR